MIKDVRINLPVKDIKKSKEFFLKLGFQMGPIFEVSENSSEAVCLTIGEKQVAVMFFAEPAFKHFIHNEVPDVRNANEVLLSFDVNTREEVDEMAKKALEAGAIVFSTPTEHQNWMYGCGFADLDGHRWNVQFMNKKAISIK